MTHFIDIDFSFFQNNYVNIICRALAVYIFMIVAIRVFGKKELAQLSVIDLVFILLISNAVQNAMVGPDTSLSGGLIAALALFAANYTLKKVLYKNKKLNDLMQGTNVLLIYNGEVQSENCKKEEISISELESAVREHGVKDIQSVQIAMLEVDGNISVVSNDYKDKANITNIKKHRVKGKILKK